LEIFIGFSEECTAKVNKKLSSLELVSIYNPQFINKGAIAVIDRPLQAIFGAAEKALFQNESVLKVGLN
jgi:hypothetical protein